MIFDFSTSKDQSKFKNNILTPFLKEAIKENPFAKYMGKDPKSLMQVQKSVAKGEGNTLVFSLRYFRNVNEVYGENTLQGKGDFQTPVNTTLTLGKTRFAVMAKDFDIAEYQTKFEFNPELQMQIKEKHMDLIIRRIVNQFAWCFAHGEKANQDWLTYDYRPREGQVISDFATYFTNRIQTCLINQLDVSGNGINSDRVLFGAEALGNVIAAGQTIQQRCLVGAPGNNGNIGTADYVQGTSGYCNLDHIMKLKYMARIGGRKQNINARINPTSTSSWNGALDEIYTYFISPSMEARLLNDSRVQQLLVRPLIEDPRQPSYFNGTQYLGRLKGVDIVVIDEFENLSIQNAAANLIGYGAFCGAGALASAICSEPKFTYQEEDHGNQKEIGITLIDGLKSIKFPSKFNPTTTPPLEYGMIHSFTLI